MTKPTRAFIQTVSFILILFCLQTAKGQPGTEITGINVSEKGDTTILTPDCNGDCPPSILNTYLFEWDLGDCSKGYGPLVRHVYTQPPSERVTMKLASIYDEDDDPELRVAVTGAPFVALPNNSFQMRAELSRVPVPDDYIEVAVTLDYDYNPSDLVGSLSVQEISTFLDLPEADTSAIRNCRKLTLKEVKIDGNRVTLDSLKNRQNGPTTLLFRYDIPGDLEIGKDTLDFRINFKGSGAGDPVNSTLRVTEPVRGSHDPNYMAADPGEFFLPEQYITYTIHFENIGTQPAKRVIISDFLSPLFIIESVQVLRTEIGGEPVKFKAEIVDRQLIFSIQGERKIGKDGKRRRVAVLAPSSVDKEKGQGLVEFRVKTVDTIGCFDHIANAAAIIFDKNPAFVTNCVVHKRFCDCQEYCKFLRLHHIEEPFQEDTIRNSIPTVPVRKTGEGGQRMGFFGEGIDQGMGEDPMQGEGTGLPTWALTLLIIAGALIILLLVLYLLK